MKKLKGYIFSRPFFGERAPQHVQNIVLRDYCNKYNYNFLLSGTEYTQKNSTYILSELLKNINFYNGLLFYSLLQLPTKREYRHNVYSTIINKKKEIHFAVENISAKTKKDFVEVEKIFLIKSSIFNRKEKFKLGSLKKYVSLNHNKVKRKYLDRMTDNKVHCMKISQKYGKDYWDGDRKYGYGGYKYKYGYHLKVAKKLIDDYKLSNNSKILDVGCGKGFLLFEIKKILPKINIIGLDISSYAIKNSKKEIRSNLRVYDCRKKLNYEDNYFDLVISINTLHNFKLQDLEFSLTEIERVGKLKYLCVESYRNNLEQFNLQCWALTAQTIINVETWKYIFKKSSYSGDFEFIYFK
jgi:sporadic carbohydrate cluster protein (TIGR04323 family)